VARVLHGCRGRRDEHGRDGDDDTDWSDGTRPRPRGDHRHSIPILASARLSDAGDGLLEVEATDLRATVRVRVPCGGALGRAVLPNARAALKVVRSSQGDVAIRPQADGRVALANGATATIPSFAPKDWPQTPRAPQGQPRAALDARGLAAALDYVLPAASGDDTRPHLCAVLFERSGPRRAPCLIATDGHRLHSAPVAVAAGALPKGGLLLPAGAARLLREAIRGATGRVELRCAAGVAFFACGDRAEVAAYLADAQFPAWRLVVPPRHRHRGTLAVADAAAARAAARAATAFLRRSLVEPGAAWEVGPGCVVVVAADDDAGEFRASFEARVEGRASRLGLNQRYVADALAFDGEARIALDGELDPVRVDGPGGLLAVVMPLRI
jgi:DNA polymerase III sliding clamp (beta) subunit (PCNA family)